MKIKTRDLALTGILTAIAIIIPLIVPLKIVLPPFTATFASHLPLILAMFISPLSAVFVAIGSAIGFLFSPLPSAPIVAARAAMHVFFVFAGAVMIRKRVNLFVVVFVTMVIHALSDMGIVYVLFSSGVNLLKGQGMAIVQEIIGIGTSLHHLVDFALAIVVLTATAKASKDIFLPMTFGSKKRDDA